MDFKNLKPWLQPPDLEYFEHCLSQCKEYLEFGSGGSTIRASQLCSTVVTVETDKSFIYGLMPYCKNTTFVFVDIGRVKKEEIPKNKKVHACKYYEAPWRYAKHPDLIFVDGRYRISTLCDLLLRTKPGTRILFDDIWKPIYQDIEKLPIQYKLIYKLGEFISPDVKDPLFLTYMRKHEFDWR